MARRAAGVRLLCLFVLGFAATAHAQGTQTGILRGLVTDGSGLPVRDVHLEVTSPALQGKREATSEEDGSYVFRALPPGDYELSVTAPRFASQQRKVAVPLGAAIEQNLELTIAPVTEDVTVQGVVPTPIASATVGANLRYSTIDALATGRSLQAIATLSPSVNENVPTPGQLSINGGIAFDNNFMVNGVDITDNLLGKPQDLFIEDALEETQVLTSAISAEFGRFGGGVVNGVTRSGGNRFSGSYRLNLSNPAWIDETPFEVDNEITHESDVNTSHESTFGGPIIKDRLWFFAAARVATQSVPKTLEETGIGVVQETRNARGELKGTYTFVPNQTVQAGYLNNATSQTNSSGVGDDAIDPNVLVTRKLPNWYYYTNYRGVLGGKYLAEAQYAERRFRFSGAGTDRNIVESPFQNPSFLVYNAPYFDESDQDERNNRQLTGNVLSFFEAAGRHELKTGYEYFRSQRVGGGAQSATDYVFDAEYLTDDDGAPVYDSQGRMIPLFIPGETQLERYVPIRGATLNVNNNSLFAQDHWAINRHVTADIGVRFEHASSDATSQTTGVSASTVVPRLALAFDPNGNGRYVLKGSYSHYSGRYNEAQIRGNSAVGNADFTIATYEGPEGQGRGFAAGFNPDNYEIESAEFPGANILVDEDLHTPLTREFTVSGGANFKRSYFDVAYIWRRTTQVIEDEINLSNGTTHVVEDGFEAGTFTNILWTNSDIGKREYQGMVLQGQVRPHPIVTVQGQWTIQLKNEGNYEGDPAVGSVIGNYPEALPENRYYPAGRLVGFQRHRARLWAIVTPDLGRYGSLSLSALTRIESGQTYSLTLRQALTPEQRALISAYPDRPGNQTVYFGGRGTELFNGYAVVDVSATYNFKVASTVAPFFKFDVFNLFNNDTQIGWNTTIRNDPASPKDAYGLATGYIEGASFGSATSNAHFPQSVVGTGLRGVRLAFGVRF